MWRKGYVLTVRGEVDIKSVVHGELLNAVDSKLHNPLYDLKVLDIIEDGNSPIETPQQNIFSKGMAFNNSGEVYLFWV